MKQKKQVGFFDDVFSILNTPGQNKKQNKLSQKDFLEVLKCYLDNKPTKSKCVDCGKKITPTDKVILKHLKDAFTYLLIVINIEEFDFDSEEIFSLVHSNKEVIKESWKDSIREKNNQ